MPRKERLNNESDIRLTYSGKKVVGKLVILHYRYMNSSLKSDKPIVTPRVAVTVSKKVSKLAVVRNKIKRRCKEIYRCNKNILPQNVWIIIRVLPVAYDADFNEIKSELTTIFKSIDTKKYSDRAY